MELDDAYAIGAHIPSAEDYPPRWAALAAAFRTQLGARAALDLPYGAGPREKFDLFHPEGPAAGTVVFVHGGYWRAFGRADWSHLAAGPLARGWAVAMPSYDLCPAVRISQISRQIARAVQEVAARQPGPLALTGHSAGGHLVARMLDPGLVPAGTGARISSAVPIAPLTDLGPLMRTTMNQDLRLDAAEAAAESPVNMTERLPARVTVWVGSDERPALIDQARWLSAAWNCALTIAEGRHHFDVIDALSDPQSDLVEALIATPNA